MTIWTDIKEKMDAVKSSSKPIKIRNEYRTGLVTRRAAVARLMMCFFSYEEANLFLDEKVH